MTHGLRMRIASPTSLYSLRGDILCRYRSGKPVSFCKRDRSGTVDLAVRTRTRETPRYIFRCRLLPYLICPRSAPVGRMTIRELLAGRVNQFAREFDRGFRLSMQENDSAGYYLTLCGSRAAYSIAEPNV
jgi:hypothetical protein